MEIELLEIRDFLASHSPFDVLADNLLDQLPRDLVIRYLRRGSEFPPADADTGYLYIVRSGAVDLRDSHGELYEKLAEGDFYDEPCRSKMPEKITGMTAEDTLLYLLSCDKLEALCKKSRPFKEMFGQTLRERMRLATDMRGISESGACNIMTQEVIHLIAREPVTIGKETSIRQVSQLMSAENVSSLLILDKDELIGLVTDRDLRSRCLAAGLNSSLPISHIMSSPLQTIQSNTLLQDALLLMTRRQLHHLPILDNHKPIGMLTVSDLVRHLSGNPAFIATDIEQAQNVESLARISRKLPELQLHLCNANASARHIGEVISSICDGITRRLIELAESTLGTAPVPYVWLAGGSQARQEQTSHSDQDNALLISDDMSEQDAEYFSRLAQSVCDGLHACGFVYCPGNAMASNPQWRQPLHIWRKYFSGWIDTPQPASLMLSSIFFDLRPVYGDAALFFELQQEVLKKTQSNAIFIAYMAANALSHRPPLGFFRDFVVIHDGEHDHTLDIKHRGIVPIIDIARIFALAQGITAVNSSERLQAASISGLVSKEMSANLQDALEFISSLRIRHQASQIRNGQAADNFLPPKVLTGLERTHLKDAFKIIKTMQDTLELRHQTARLT